MPPTTENIADRPAFDVYGAILVLSCLATLGAALLMRQELLDNWGWGVDKANSEAMHPAVHITEMNKDPDKYRDFVQVTDSELAEWEKIKGKGTKFPVDSYKWPEGFDPLENPVKPGANNLETIPEAQRNALMKDWTPASEGAAPAEKKEGTEPPPAEKKEEAKKEETKKEEPKTEEKKDEAKKEEPKTEEKKEAPKAEPKAEEKKEEPKAEEKKEEPKAEEKKAEEKKAEGKKEEPKAEEKKA